MARLLSIPINRPGSLGLNALDDGDVLPLQWATVFKNIVLDDSGILSSREGSKRLHASALANSVESIVKYTDATGSSVYVVGAGNKLYKVTGAVATDITGTTTPTNGNWKFQNFNGKLVGWQTGESAIVIDNVSDTFDDLVATTGSIPSGNEVLSAFGRLWVIDGDDLKWCDLLIETAWSGGSSGSQPLTHVWPNYDQGVSLAEHNGFLIIFGSDNIVIYEEPGTPANLAKVEAVQGAGSLGRDCVIATPSDLVYLSKLGPLSLGRTVQEKSAPVTVLAPQVRNSLKVDVDATASADLKMAYQQKGVAYIRTDDNLYVIDLRREGAPVSTWDTSDVIYGEGDNLVLGKTTWLENSEGFLDSVNSDNTGGSTYKMTYESGWTDLSSSQNDLSSFLKYLKRIVPYTIGGGGYSVTIGWVTDFSTTFNTISYTIPNTIIWKFGESKYTIGTWDIDTSIRRESLGASRSPRILKVKFETTVNGVEISLTRIDIQVKAGRQI